MKYYLFLTSLVFSSFGFADQAISTNCLNPLTHFAIIQNHCFQDMINSIESNNSNISGNTANISNNAASISSLTNAIGDNQGLIGNAQQVIGVNTNNISSNSLTITSIQLDNLMQFKKLSSGVASSIAISNVDYADEGWSIGIGAGNFNSETEYAFGLSFASENTSFKIATSKDSSALGINYKFGR